MMKIALLQCNVVCGDAAGNAAILRQMVRDAAGADLCVAPLEALWGPDAACLRRQWDFRSRSRQILEQLAGELRDCPPLICGLPGPRAFLLDKGLPLELPEQFFIGGREFLLLNEDSRAGVPQKREQIILDLRSRPFRPGGQAERETRLASLAAEAGWLLSPNLAGGYGSHIYSGQSFAADPLGRIRARALAFAPDILLADTLAQDSSLAPAPAGEAEQWQALTLGLRDFVRKSGASDVLLGLSGGMDSALVACIAAEALGPEHVRGILMPSPWSSKGSVDDSLALAANLGIRTWTIPIEPAMSAIQASLTAALPDFADNAGTALENIQARARGLILMAMANRTGALVLNTSNKSEAAMGYSTLYGDTVGALAVIGDIFKTRVYELARWHCDSKGKMIIPEEIFVKAPSAELRPNQKDSDSLPPYEELDPMLARLFAHLPPEPGREAELLELRQKVQAARFKRRQCPPPLLAGGDPIDCQSGD